MSGGNDGTTSDLLSPGDAIGRLEKTLKDYFAWKLLDSATGKPSTRVLVKSPPGLGKTKSGIIRAIDYQLDQGAVGEITFEQVRNRKRGDIGPTGIAQTVIFTMRHDLAREAQKSIKECYDQRGLTLAVPVLRGRTDQSESGNAPCKRWREADALQKNGYPVFSNLCRHASGDEVRLCPYYSDCEYIKNYQDAYDAPFVIMVHSHLGLPRRPHAEVLDQFEEPDDPKTRRFYPEYATTVICDEDPSQHLIEKKILTRPRLQELIDDGIGSRLVAGLDAAEGMLAYLRKNGFNSDRVREIARKVQYTELTRGNVVAPDATDAAIGKQIAAAPKRITLTPILQRLADELASGRGGPSYSLIADGEKVVAQGRRPYPFPQSRLLVLDGTADPRILEKFIPGLHMPAKIRVRRNAHVVQIRDMTFYKGRLIAGEDESGALKPRKRLEKVATFIETVAETGKTLVVCNKPVRCALTGEKPDELLPVSTPYCGADVAHFGKIRGVNDFEDHRYVIIVGREELPIADAERLAMAIWYDTRDVIKRVQPDTNGQRNYPKEPRSYQHPPGHPDSKPVLVSVHPDRRVQAVLEQRREAESLQAIDRLRLIHNEEIKYVWILCNIPLDLPVDCVTTWKHLFDASGQFRNIFRNADSQGWNAVSLAAQHLHAKFPDLWATEKAAAKWLEKKPLDACKGIIRKWGVLTDYRPNGQRSWSKAIVRLGVADKEAAIESALALSPGSVFIR